MKKQVSAYLESKIKIGINSLIYSAKKYRYDKKVRIVFYNNLNTAVFLSRSLSRCKVPNYLISAKIHDQERENCWKDDVPITFRENYVFPNRDYFIDLRKIGLTSIREEDII